MARIKVDDVEFAVNLAEQSGSDGQWTGSVKAEFRRQHSHAGVEKYAGKLSITDEGGLEINPGRLPNGGHGVLAPPFAAESVESGLALLAAMWSDNFAANEARQAAKDARATAVQAEINALKLPEPPEMRRGRLG